MAKMTIHVSDEDLAFLRSAAEREGVAVSRFVIQAAKAGALWADANRPRPRTDAADLARAEELAALDAAAEAEARKHGHGHAA
ncbi:hypothetical protein OG225_42890 (plasmid) [Nocardia sp. NBC_01377]|uniref:hypothetical protein n=1 Tax=Nocardia sp. NBC_01377 TaxID=2903595 RepID=UPI002F90EE88